MDALIDRFRVLSEVSSDVGRLVNFGFLATSQVSSSFVSLVSSATMATMIARTEKGLTTPYRRIIFGLSISDIAQSSALFFGPFAIPHDVEFSWGIGNTRTCQMDGAFLVTGTAAVPMYTCFLCLYYLCKLKFRMDNELFARRIERKIHIFIILFNVVQTIAALALNTLNPAIFKTCCGFAATPLGCRLYPEIVGECDPIIHSRVFNFVMVNNFFLVPLCLVGMIGMMSMLSYHAMVLNRMTPPTLAGPNTTTTTGRRPSRPREVQNIEASMISTAITVEETHLRTRSNDVRENIVNQQQPDDIDNILDSMLSSEMEESEEAYSSQSRNVFSLNNDDREQPQQQPQPQSPVQNQARNLSELYRNETMIQALLYVGSFCIVYLPLIITYGYGVIHAPPPKYIQVSTFLILPLGGLLNILVYTRPQAASLRRNHPSLSRLRCVWLVLRAGGELPTLPGAESNDVTGTSNQAPVELHEESVSEIQIGLESRPPSELIIKGLRSNNSGSSESNVDQSSEHVRSGGSRAVERMDNISELTNPNFNFHTNTLTLESIQEHDG